jgi:hypothetical protein
MPYKAERWMSFSVLLSKNWNADKGDWGPIVFQVKSSNQDGTGNGPTFSISAAGEYNTETWQIDHRWSPGEQPSQIRWQYIDKWDRVNDHAHAAVEDFPDREQSELALGNLNRGGWTDFVIHYRPDADGLGQNGAGFLDVWMHFADELGNSFGDWIKVLEVRPRVITRGGLTFDRGVAFRDSGGYSINTGMYMAASRVWGLTDSRTLYNANIRIGGSGATFADMSPDGTEPGGGGQDPEAAPKPPSLLID